MAITDIIVFTSWYAAEYFLNEFLSVKPEIQFDQKIFAIIGRRTRKALQKYNIQPTVVAEEETAEGLFKAMANIWN